MSGESNRMYSQKGKCLNVIDEYKFRYHKMLANETLRWTCTNKSCSSYLKISVVGTIVEKHTDHNHPADAADRVDNVFERLRKIFRKQMDYEALETPTSKDIDIHM